MAQATLAPFLNSLSGKLGGIVARKVGDKQYIKQIAIPYHTQPRDRSPAQLEIWRRYGNLYDLYTKLDPLSLEGLQQQAENLQISAWNVYVKKYIQFPDGPPPPPPPSFKLLANNTGYNRDLTDHPTRLNLVNVPELFEACASDPTQLELYTNDRTTPAQFFIESWNPATSSANLILSTTTPALQTAEYYLEVNRDRITPLSNRDSVYIFYDDFTDWATLADRWQGDISSLTRSGNNAILSGSNNTVTTINKFNNCIIDWYGYQTAVGSAQFGLTQNSPYVNISLQTYGYLSSSIKNASSSGACGWKTSPYGWGGWFKFTIKRFENSISDFLVNGSHTSVSPCPAAANNAEAPFFMYAYYAYGQSPYCGICDQTGISYLKVRKYADPEPTAELIEIISNA